MDVFEASCNTRNSCFIYIENSFVNKLRRWVKYKMDVIEAS